MVYSQQSEYSNIRTLKGEFQMLTYAKFREANQNIVVLAANNQQNSRKISNTNNLL